MLYKLSSFRPNCCHYSQSIITCSVDFLYSRLTFPRSCQIHLSDRNLGTKLLSKINTQKRRQRILLAPVHVRNYNLRRTNPQRQVVRASKPVVCMCIYIYKGKETTKTQWGSKGIALLFL